MPARKGSTCGNIKERGPNQFRVRVYAGKDPISGKPFYLKSTEQPLESLPGQGLQDGFRTLDPAGRPHDGTCHRVNRAHPAATRGPRLGHDRGGVLALV